MAMVAKFEGVDLLFEVPQSIEDTIGYHLPEVIKLFVPDLAEQLDTYITGVFMILDDHNGEARYSAIFPNAPLDLSVIVDAYLSPHLDQVATALNDIVPYAFGCEDKQCKILTLSVEVRDYDTADIDHAVAYAASVKTAVEARTEGVQITMTPVGAATIFTLEESLQDVLRTIQTWGEETLGDSTLFSWINTLLQGTMMLKTGTNCIECLDMDLAETCEETCPLQVVDATSYEVSLYFKADLLWYLQFELDLFFDHAGRLETFIEKSCNCDIKIEALTAGDRPANVPAKLQSWFEDVDNGNFGSSGLRAGPAEAVVAAAVAAVSSALLL